MASEFSNRRAQFPPCFRPIVHCDLARHNRAKSGERAALQKHRAILEADGALAFKLHRRHRHVLAFIS